MRVFGCRRFGRLSSEKADRQLNTREIEFMSRHREFCDECRESESHACVALNMLRASALDVEVSPGFDDRLMRKLRVQTGRASVRYWSPAIAGAAIAGLAVVAALQVITRSSQIPHLKIPGGEARRIQISKPLPSLDSDINRTVVR